MMFQWSFYLNTEAERMIQYTRCSRAPGEVENSSEMIIFTGIV